MALLGYWLLTLHKWASGLILCHTCVFVNGESAQSAASSDRVPQLAVSSPVVVLSTDRQDTCAHTRVLLH